MSAARQLDLRPDEWVEVRSEAEILTTLDDDGTLEGVSFMPEMLSHCGQRYQVYKRADKTCDTVNWTGLRRMERTVHLNMLRCNGSAHGGCQAGCLIFWKEAWLRRLPENGGQPPVADDMLSAQGPVGGTVRDRTWLEQTVHRNQPIASEILYRCQATELNRASCPLPWWEPKQYVRDLRTNRVPLADVARGIAIAAFSKFRRLFGGRSFPHVAGSLKRTPTESLALQAGEWVVVKSKEEILATLDGKSRNRGLTFDIEMLPYCGKSFRVLRRVERIIEEASGRMIEPAGVSIILDNVICAARYRRSCPRSIYPFWREIWSARATADKIPDNAPEGLEPICSRPSV